MRLYIDPGTGSMLFAVLLGLFGALNWLVKGWIVKLRFLISGGKQKEQTEDDAIPLVILSDNKRYWNVFEPICRELDNRGFDVTYMTASPDDPALNNPYPHIHSEFIGEGNKAFAKLNFLKATILLSTTPGLDVYQWKRSKGVKYYVHILHAAGDIAGYRMFGTDYYDAVLLSNDRQYSDVRQLEDLRGLPEKELVKVGVPYMDEMAKRLKNAPATKQEGKTILLAPSWGKSAILSRFGGEVIDALLKTDYHIIIRPHPQSFTSEKEMLEKLMESYPASERIEWNTDTDNFEVLKRSDIMISDFSGVIYDFALVYDKPIIYTETEFDNSPYDAWWLKRDYWTFDVLPLLGEQLTMQTLDKLPELIENCLNESCYTEKRKRVREEMWSFSGEGTNRVADYLIEKYQSLTTGKKSN